MEKVSMNKLEMARRAANGTGGGVSPAVIEEMQAEISILGSQNKTQAQDITDIKGSLNSINDNLTNLEERIDLMNFEYFDVRTLAPNANQGYNLNLDKITYISLVSGLSSTDGYYGLYKVENGALTYVSGERYTPYFNLSDNVLTITNPSSTYLAVTVAY